MKKTPILLYFTILSLIIFSSCKKDPDTPAGISFTATTSDYVKCSAKTTMTEFTPLWSVGDNFYVWGNDSTPHRCHTSESGVNKALFKYDTLPAATPGSPFTAIYPSQLYLSPTRITVPPSQSSATGSLTNAPMYASSNSTDLTFHNLCGVIRLKLIGENANRIYYAILIANQRINGQYELLENPDNADCPQLSYASGGSTNTILQVSNPIQGDGTYYIALPAGTYNSLAVYLYTLDHTFASVSLSHEGPVIIKQGAVTPFTLSDITFRESGTKD